MTSSELLSLNTFKNSDGWSEVVKHLALIRNSHISNILKIDPDNDEKVYSKSDLDKYALSLIDTFMYSPQGAIKMLQDGAEGFDVSPISSTEDLIADYYGEEKEQPKLDELEVA